MAVVQFNVSDELARQIRGLVASGRPSEITFVLRAGVVTAVRAANTWDNELATRTFKPTDTPT